MRLGLSSAAAPDLSLADLVEGCRRRGMTSLELVIGDGHGVGGGPDRGDVDESLRLARLRGVPVVAIAYEGGDPARSARTLQLARRIAVPAILTASAMGRDGIEAAARYAHSLSAKLLLLHRGDPERAAELVAILDSLADPNPGVAWEVDPSIDEPEAAAEVITTLGPRLAYVRLRGGGPESIGQTGLGVGTLMGRLAVARFGGPLIIAPSTPRYLRAWRQWLTRGGGWGCGSKISDPSLVSLDPPTTTLNP